MTEAHAPWDHRAMDRPSRTDRRGSPYRAGLDALSQDYRAAVDRVLADPRMSPGERHTCIEIHKRRYRRRCREELGLIGDQMVSDARLLAKESGHVRG